MEAPTAPAVSSLCMAAPLPPPPNPLHAAGGGPHVADARRIQENGGFGKGWGSIDKLCHEGHICAMATMNISLPDPMKSYVEAQTLDGRYANASDYVRDLIRRDQARQAVLIEIQTLVDEAVASGPSTPFNMQAYLARRERL